MSLDKKHIQNILDANNDNSLAIFVGAGISKTSETDKIKLPSWSDLINQLKDELNIQDENDFLKIAQLYYLEFGEFTYYRKLKDFIPDYIKPSKIHELIFRLNPHNIVTTNWDDILERTIEENAFIYDVIRSDMDLTKSSLQNKLIKMHGDFLNNNIVFKEDDYLNYSYNFPLLENYIKSILSTHTVLFLGYSYSDFNIKQILKWIQNRSEVRPPMYLTTFEKKPTFNQYLDNHGITTLQLEETSKKSPFENEYSNRVHTFLKRLLNQDARNIAKSEKDVLEFILNKLGIFEALDGILLEQIQNALTNCGFIYDEDSKAILEFYDGEITGDYDKTRRKIYKKFVSHLKDIDNGKEPNEKLIQTFKILDSADIKGIVISKDNSSKEYIVLDDYLDSNISDQSIDSLNFNFTNLERPNDNINEILNYAFKLYDLDRYEEAFSSLETAISQCLKQRNYAYLFIAMFNRNVLLRQLKYSFNRNIDRGKYEEIDKYDLHDRYFNLPRNLRVTLEPIYRFVDRTLIIQYAYELSEDLKETQDSKRIVESGGFVFKSYNEKYQSRHNNLVKFVLRNKIFVEHLSVFESINRYSIKIAIIRQVQKDIISLSKIELFSCIKYVDYKDLKVILKDFYGPKSEKTGQFQLSEGCQTWLINEVFQNAVDNFISSEIIFNKFEKYIQKVLFLLSLSKHTEEEFEQIISTIARIISEGNNTFPIYKSINLFLGIQHNLYKTEIDQDTLLDLIKNLINKIILRKSTGLEYRAITTNELYNLYGYAHHEEVIMKDEKLVEKLLIEVNEYPISDQIEVSQNLLLNIYDISNDVIKDKIKSFILEIDLRKEEKDYKRIVFKLTLAIYGFISMEDKLIDEIKEYIEDLKEKNMFSSVLYTIKGQSEYLLEKGRKIQGLEEILSEISVMIEQYEESKGLSIF